MARKEELQREMGNGGPLDTNVIGYQSGGLRDYFWGGTVLLAATDTDRTGGYISIRIRDESEHNNGATAGRGLT